MSRRSSSKFFLRRALAVSCAAYFLLLAGCTDDVEVTPDFSDSDVASQEDTPDAASARDSETVDLAELPPCGCFEVDGTYCSTTVAELAEGRCRLPDIEEGLWQCEADTYTFVSACDQGCESGETAGNDACSLPLCECFVQVAWCGSGAQKHASTFEEPCRVPLLPEHDGDILACDSDGNWIIKEACEMGCYEAPTGTPDYCVGTRTPDAPGSDPCPSKPLIRSGVHPEASDRLRCAGVQSDEISQTVGYATASAGYHAADGSVDGRDYTAAVDIRTRGMSEAQIRDRLDLLAHNGFAAWYRKPGSDGWPSSGAPHIHAIFTGVRMKSQLRGQVRDFLIGRNGLSSHSVYRFWSPQPEDLEIVTLLFSRNYTP